MFFIDPSLIAGTYLFFNQIKSKKYSRNLSKSEWFYLPYANADQANNFKLLEYFSSKIVFFSFKLASLDS